MYRVSISSMELNELHDVWGNCEQHRIINNSEILGTAGARKGASVVKAEGQWLSEQS